MRRLEDSCRGCNVGRRRDGSASVNLELEDRTTNIPVRKRLKDTSDLLKHTDLLLTPRVGGFAAFLDAPPNGAPLVRRVAPPIVSTWGVGWSLVSRKPTVTWNNGLIRKRMAAKTSELDWGLDPRFWSCTRLFIGQLLKLKRHPALPEAYVCGSSGRPLLKVGVCIGPSLDSTALDSTPSIYLQCEGNPTPLDYIFLLVG